MILFLFYISLVYMCGHTAIDDEVYFCLWKLLSAHHLV